MIVIGITGQSGAGKSIASDVFRNRGITIIDADRIAREVVLPGTETYLKIKEEFGEKYFNEDDTLNRKKLGNLVFSDSNKLAKLNSIIHPAICSIIEEVISEERQKGVSKAIVVDAPLLKQVGLDKLCDIVIVITSDIENRIKRITSRDDITYESAKNRMLKQENESYYIKNATKIFNNDGTIEDLFKKINKYADELGL